MTTSAVADEAEVNLAPVHASAEERQAQQHLPYAALRTLIEAGEIRTVMLAVPDLQGRLKGKRFEAGHFLKRIARRSADMCAYVLATDVDMSPADGFALTSWEQGYQDLSVWPDLKSTRLVPWRERTAVVFGDAVTHDGVRVEVAPREILRRQLNRLAEFGLYPMTGIETEFSLYRGTDTAVGEDVLQGLRPLAAGNLDYSLDHGPRSDRFFSRLQEALMGAGLPVEAVKSEAGPGQVEVTFRYGNAEMACERHLLFKHAVRALAARAGLTPTFMAAPETGLANGMHVHISLWSGTVSALGDPDGRLTETGRHAIAGLLTGLPRLAPLFAPNTNSYKRFVRGSFVPTAFTWGYDNRTCAVRVVGEGRAGLRLEVRVAGADANPYLVVAAVLASITHGIEHQLQPGPAHRGNAYNARGGVHLMPATLYDALVDFEDSVLAREAFGPAVVGHVVRLAELELDHAQREVTDVERRRWLAHA
ncbi:glutamine synthetase [Streptomyces roseirectus]|uniref:Glutamine synthetase n=1 Tax=Streptomyces roseirectus TaxID=2768066 RepID=A0A7H0IQ85_9ACTN|nr:glutamine synthetase family protein [Streptomyces roseirectus]QNP74951.1 glutamine synthetase [Streptomyces roseirectus]